MVDYGRVAGWTKSSRLPDGKSSVFDMQKLFIPINQGNVHWVLVVVDMDTTGGAKVVVSFFDSFGRDGTTYVEASFCFAVVGRKPRGRIGSPGGVWVPSRSEASFLSPRWPSRVGQGKINC